INGSPAPVYKGLEAIECLQMVQGYTQQNSGSKGGWTSYLDSRRAEGGKPFSGTIIYRNEVLLCSYTCGVAHDQWTASLSKESKLSRIEATDRETGGSMLNVTGLNQFYYLRDFTDMRCKHSRVLSIIREQLHREPNDGDVFIVMSRDRRIVRLFAYDNRSYSLFEKKFVAGYQFMKVEREGGERVYRIDWKDVVLLLENPIVNTLKIR
ncbi:IS66 family insertion sequence element accessory protein TnpB, partial [Prevotella sp.]|uniref:IS66 family insertion sequence element accessory protein TnpB n=3 Tax=Prevotella sp. TaxID=59823 RepID=UPI003076F412